MGVAVSRALVGGWGPRHPRKVWSLVLVCWSTAILEIIAGPTPPPLKGGVVDLCLV